LELSRKNDLLDKPDFQYYPYFYILKLYKMATTVHDDYLGCDDYKKHISNKHSQHKDFSTFKSESDHYFSWNNGDQLILRSEAYPDQDKLERGISAVIKNRDLPERYIVDEVNGKFYLLLFGGGDHQKHTGDRDKHSEIGRSCPHQSREDIHNLLLFKGNDFADQVVPISRKSSASTESEKTASAAAGVAAAGAAMASSSASSSSTSSSHSGSSTHSSTHTGASSSTAYSTKSNDESDGGGGMGWLKWLLPLLLIGALAFLWKKCKTSGSDEAHTETTVSSDGNTDTQSTNTGAGENSGTTNADSTGNANASVSSADASANAKVTVDPATGVVNYDLGASGDVTLPNGDILKGVAQNGFENTLINFIKNGSIDTINKKANWFTIHDVQFKTNSTEYANEKSIAQIDNTARILKAYPNVVLKLGGYTDVRGDEKANKDLSDRRAKQAMKDLIAKGASASQIKEAVGYGEEFAIAAESDQEGMARDRKTACKVAVK
jgi:outer membrane protein OmpA-like peptidoglycan-associated protein